MCNSSDEELRRSLKFYRVDVGPLTASTKPLWNRHLQRLKESDGAHKHPSSHSISGYKIRTRSASRSKAQSEGHESLIASDSFSSPNLDSTLTDSPGRTPYPSSRVTRSRVTRNGVLTRKSGKVLELESSENEGCPKIKRGRPSTKKIARIKLYRTVEGSLKEDNLSGRTPDGQIKGRKYSRIHAKVVDTSKGNYIAGAFFGFKEKCLNGLLPYLNDGLIGAAFAGIIIAAMLVIGQSLNPECENEIDDALP